MDKQLLIVVGTIVVIALLRGAVWVLMHHRHRTAPLGRFGPRFRPCALSREQRLQFTQAWRTIEDTFSDDPALALSQADRQVVEVMQARGFPIASFEQRPEEVATENPDLVENFRAARHITRAAGAKSKDVMHRAMVHYRALFDDLVDVPVTEWQQARG